MKISYLFNSSIPSDLPSSLQVAKMCEGMQKLADEVLALPIAEHITEDDVKYISDIIYKFYN